MKIYETQDDSSFKGYTNLWITDSADGYEGGFGYGTSVEQALEETIRNFMDNLLEHKKNKQAGLSKEDLVLLPYDEY